jgi:deoxyadenosine/deoxycytidine kinase
VIVSISGLPGSGKTTVIRALASLSPATVWPEEAEDFPLVAHGDRNNQHLVFLNQADFVVRKIGQAVSMGDSPGLHLVEVDWMTCHAQWTTALWRSGRISGAQRDAVQLVHDSAIAAGIPRPDQIFYLHAPVELLLTRIAARRRDFESRYAAFVSDLAEVGPAHLEAQIGRRVDVMDAGVPAGEIAAEIAAGLRAAGRA